MAKQPCNICLLGPSGAGKSAIVASLVHAVDRRLHGFPPDRPFKIADREDENRADGSSWIFRVGEQSKLERDFLAQSQEKAFVSTALKTVVYKFFVNSEPCNVIDTGGELLVEAQGQAYMKYRNTAEKERTKQMKDHIAVFDAFVAELSRCQCLVLTLPLVKFRESDWAPQLAMIVNEMIRLRSRMKVVQVIVAWTHYDTLLAPFGPFARVLACHPRRAREAIRLALAQHTMINALLDRLRQAFESEDGLLPIHHVAISSHGFIGTNGASFTQLDKDSATYLGPSPDALRDSIRAFWRPFLSADPVLAGVVGPQGHALMFPHQEVRPTGRASNADDVKIAAKLRFLPRQLRWIWVRLRGRSRATSQARQPK